MNWDRYTIKSQEILQGAIQKAQELGQQAIEPLHLLAATLMGGGHLVEAVLPNIVQFRQKVNEELNRLPKVEGGEPYLSSDAAQILQRAEQLSGE
ncbi:MAG: type VI secretion system ATPase TssH, partial [Bacteroidales bacterium]|nr:type VI secretion system ATPase TssH [Bacteroidales bacterium]MDY3067247.1 type VI secretion system ATPase TssH [Porphyromonas sp.]